MIYDDVNRKWLPSGSSSGLSRVHIYQHVANNTFRVVGRKLQDHEVSFHPLVLLLRFPFAPSFGVSRRPRRCCCFPDLELFFPSLTTKRLFALIAASPARNKKGCHKLRDRQRLEVQPGDSDFPPVARPEAGVRVELQHERRC